jgi:hypothetical protein
MLLLLTTLSAPLFSWTAAPAAEAVSPEDIGTLIFADIAGMRDLEGLLIDEDGWFWLKNEYPGNNGAEAIMFSGPSLGWSVWWNSREIASSGSGPPNWQPPPENRVLIIIPADAEQGDIILLKTYIRRGYARSPGPPEYGLLEPLEQRYRLLNLADKAVPAAAAVLGLIVFALAMAAGRGSGTGRTARGLFGLFIAAASMESAVLLFPELSRHIPWIVPALLTRITLPFAVCFWKKSVTVPGGRDPLWLSVIDIAFASFAAFALTVSLLGYPQIPFRFRRYLTTDVLLWYTAYAAATGLLFWIYHTAAGAGRRLATLFTFLAALAPSLVQYFLQRSFNPLPGTFFKFGLPSALMIALIGLASSGRGGKSVKPGFSGVYGAEENPGEAEEIEELEDAEELEDTEEVEEIEGFVPFEYTGPDPVGGGKEEPPYVRENQAGKISLLKSNIRSSLYPDSIPWDPNWDIASARQGSAHPATGFHDIYTTLDSRIQGFSFMESGSESLESLIFTHLVKSSLRSCFEPGVPLPRIARTVHRKSLGAANAAGRSMRGVIGRFQGNRLALLPLSLPPLLLRREDSGSIAELWPGRETPPNPPLAKAGFGASGLKTVSVEMTKNDIVIAYTPSITEIRSASGEPLGIGRFTGIVRDARGGKADIVISDIIGAVKDFCGNDILPRPLQLLLIRKS